MGADRSDHHSPPPLQVYGPWRRSYLFTPTTAAEDTVLRKNRQACMVRVQATDDQLYSMVLGEIAADQQLVGDQVLVAVLTAFIHICD